MAELEARPGENFPVREVIYPCSQGEKVGMELASV